MMQSRESGHKPQARCRASQRRLRWDARVRNISKLIAKFFFGYRQPGAQAHPCAGLVGKTLSFAWVPVPSFAGQYAGMPGFFVAEGWSSCCNTGIRGMAGRNSRVS